MYNFLGLYIATLLVSSLVSYIALKSIILENSKKELIDIINIVDLNLPNVDNVGDFIKNIRNLFFIVNHKHCCPPDLFTGEKA